MINLKQKLNLLKTWLSAAFCWFEENKLVGNFFKIFSDKRRKGNLLSRPFRLLFSGRKVGKLQSIVLIFTLTITGLVSASTPVFGQPEELEEVTIRQEISQPITTETTFRHPVEGYLSQGYHWGHWAIDIAGNAGKDISPVANGEVIEVSSSRWGYGHKVVVKHGENLVSLYAHMDEMKVEIGQQVDKNTILGTVGSTGWSTGAHLHLEIWENNKAINPILVIPGWQNN